MAHLMPIVVAALSQAMKTAVFVEWFLLCHCRRKIAAISGVLCVD